MQEGSAFWVNKNSLVKSKFEHQDTSKWWIYYSDIFGIGMLVIAFTGMFIERGKNSFQGRGRKLALIGIIFPLIFLFLLT